MQNEREMQSTSLKYDDGRKTTDAAAAHGQSLPMPRSGLVQRPLSVRKKDGATNQIEAVWSLTIDHL